MTQPTPPPPLRLGPTWVDDTFAEAFTMTYARLVVTAHDDHWLAAGAREATGCASSVIACDCEAGVERWLAPDETPDGRPGAALLFFAFSAEALARALATRVGQCLMTCASAAVYDGLPDATQRVPLGKHLRFFGDGHQKSKLVAGRRYWRIPVMDGEFLVEETAGVAKGVAGGNLILQCATLSQALGAARRGIEAIASLEGAITPFPGGIARSGSKVGSRYKGLKASTSDPFCPALRGRVATKLYPDVHCALEIVVDGIDRPAVERALRAGLKAVAGDDVIAVSAGNYGGKLGKHHFHLRELIATAD